MGCNTTKEAIAPVDENSSDQKKADGQPGNGAAVTSQEEVADDFVDPNDPEAQKAATKIQAVFRGHQTRRNMQSGDIDAEQAALEAEFRADDEGNRRDAAREQLDQTFFQQFVSELCHAATRIQASFRGHMARKTAATKEKDDSERLSQQMQKLDANKPDEEELDIDLTDPELHKAATKIQASFRGHKVRKEDGPATQ